MARDEGVSRSRVRDRLTAARSGSPTGDVTRVRAEDLRELVARVWQGDATQSVVATYGPIPPGHRAVDRYAVVPSRKAPRYLLPMGSRRAVLSSFSRYLATPSRRRRLQGRALGALWFSGLGELLFRDRLTVAVPDNLAAGAMSEPLLLHRLADLLVTDDLVAAWPVRRAMPNAKPTARLLDRHGAPVGYLKLGWSPATRELVRNETSVLELLADRAGDLMVPRVVATGSWDDREFLVTSPLPPLGSVTRSPETWPDLLLDIARSTGPITESALTVSAWLADVETRLDECEPAQPHIVSLLRSLLRLAVADDPSLLHGRWHGDLVPWNLGMRGPTTVFWDWEYSAQAAPLGFDLLHWHFQTALAPATATLAVGMQAVDAAALRLGCLGVDPSAAGSVAACYVVEILTRATRLAAMGAGWNPKIRNSLEAVVRSRLR